MTSLAQLITVGSIYRELTEVTDNVVKDAYNAFKYADKEKGTSFLNITIKREDASLVIAFEDNGVGIVEGRVKWKRGGAQIDW